MHLMYYLDAEGKRVYTLKVSNVLLVETQLQSFPFLIACVAFLGTPTVALQKQTPAGKITESAHPARFSPDDKFSRHRVACKKRFGIYLPDTTMKPM